jgi:hypothetical protein
MYDAALLEARVMLHKDTVGMYSIMLCYCTVGMCYVTLVSARAV